MPVATFAAGLIEAGLNRWLAWDPEWEKKKTDLKPGTLAIQVEDLSLELFLFFSPEGIQVFSRWDGEPDTRLSGKAQDFISLARSDDRLFSGEVRLRGKMELAQQLQKILKDANVSGYAILEPLTGPTLAHYLASAGEDLWRYGRERRQRLQEDISEWLRYEIRLTPDRCELEEFRRGVRQLRGQEGKLEARLKKLEQKQQVS